MELQRQIEEVKDLRNILTTNCGSVKRLPGSRERSLAITKLEEAVMWLGKDLQRIGEDNPRLLANPYPTSRDPSVPTIDPPAPEIAPDLPENTAGC